MKKLTIHYKRVKFTYIKATLSVIFISLLCVKGVTAFEKTGDNYFYIQVNGMDVGTVSDPQIATNILVEARRDIAMKQTELVFMDADMTYTGEEVFWGFVDNEDTLRRNIEKALKSGIKETMQRSYTVKVNEYMVNLSSTEEVEALLQANLDKYDTEHKFGVELLRDNQREFNVLTADVINRQDKIQQEKKQESIVFIDAGTEEQFRLATESAEPEVEKGFEDYDLGLTSINFTEEVEIVEAYLPIAQLTPIEQAIDDVTKEQEVNTLYKIVSGDTLSEISIKVNIPMDKIIAMNPTLEDENSTIRVDDELIITVPEPELSIERQEVEYIEEIYDAEVIYVDNDNWYTTKKEVLQQPSAGFRKIIAKNYYINDSVDNREIIKEEVVMEAVAKIVERGTKIPPTYIKPISGGRASSGFGRRTAPRRGASTNHKGQDWAVPTGTSVVASCGGTVSKAGWGSGYGYVVYINHVDGRQTRYGHLSKVLVKSGQTVKQGERIALSGNTGISSGPHLHFEMLINGSQVNPLKYLN